MGDDNRKSGGTDSISSLANPRLLSNRFVVVPISK